MPRKTPEYCKQHLIGCFVHPAIASLFRTWSQVVKFDMGNSLETSLAGNQESMTALQALKTTIYPETIVKRFNLIEYSNIPIVTPEYCREYLVKNFIHPTVAALFTTWEEVIRFEDGNSIQDSLQTEEAIAGLNALKTTGNSQYIIDFLDNASEL